MAAKEAERIAGLFLNVEAVIGSKASISSVTSKMPKCNIIHFATHGVRIQKRSPSAYIPGALVLGDNDDGMHSKFFFDPQIKCFC